MVSDKLSALKVKRLTAPGRYGDGAGLWLQVRDADHRSWLLRYQTAGKARQMGLGPYPDVSLADARDAAKEARAAVRKGVDPIEERRQRKADARAAAGAMTFRQVADRYLAAHEAAWRSPKHKWQWRQTLDLACVSIGSKRVAAITTDDVMLVLEPMWMQRTETAARLRGRIEAVLDYARVRGWRSGDNPARWRGHLAKLLAAPSKLAKTSHFPALPWEEIGAFMTELRDQDGIAARALEFTILTAARTGEVIGATWAEIDMQAAVWTVPPGRMKAGKEHRVPLSDAALPVLRAMAPLRNDGAGGWVFPGGKANEHLSDMGMIMLLRRMGRADLSVHGFRSTFRDWSAEATNHPREIAEKALAHTLRDETERAYQRGDLLEKRRRLMADWAEYCGRAPDDSGRLVQFRLRLGA
jgi:integrase